MTLGNRQGACKKRGSAAPTANPQEMIKNPHPTRKVYHLSSNSASMKILYVRITEWKTIKLIRQITEL